MADQDDQGCAAARGVLPRQPGEPPPEARVRRRRDGDAGGALLADGEAEVAALAAALRRAVDELLDLGVTFPVYAGTAIVGYGCTLCAGTGEAEAAVEHAADCPVAALARHDAARQEEG